MNNMETMFCAPEGKKKYYCHLCGNELTEEDILSGTFDMTTGKAIVYTLYTCPMGGSGHEYRKPKKDLEFMYRKQVSDYDL